MANWKESPALEAEQCQFESDRGYQILEAWVNGQTSRLLTCRSLRAVRVRITPLPPVLESKPERIGTPLETDVCLAAWPSNGLLSAMVALGMC